MAESVLPLTALSEAQRAQALERFTIICPVLEEDISQAQVVRTHQVASSTIQLWIKRYREKGLAGLANNVAHSDKGTFRKLPQATVQMIEGLALQNPPRSVTSIHRQVTAITKEQGWNPPSYHRVYTTIKQLDPALVTLAHERAAYREDFDLLYRREAPHANAMWQTDHTPLDAWVRDEEGKLAQPWFTAVKDDHNRAIVGYRLSFQAATARTTTLTFRQAIWRKEDPYWHVCGIPSTFYTNHESDFTSKHIEQVAADLGVELIFSQVSIPRSRSKIERFFQSVNQLFLQDIPGDSPAGYTVAKAALTFAQFEQRFRTRLLCDYHHCVHSETNCRIRSAGKQVGFSPRLLDSFAQLDLFLLTVAKTRRVQQDGIRFQGHRSIDPTLASYVKEDVLIRYDPADLAEIRVFYHNRFLCRAICQDLSGQTVILKDIEKARSERRKPVKAGLTKCSAIVEQFLAVHQEDPPRLQASVPEPVVPGTRPLLKRYINE